MLSKIKRICYLFAYLITFICLSYKIHKAKKIHKADCKLHKLKYFLYTIIYIMCACSVVSVASGSLRPCGLQPARLLSPLDSLGKNTRVGYLALLQRIFPTQELNMHLLQCRQILYPLNYLGSPTNFTGIH